MNKERRKNGDLTRYSLMTNQRAIQRREFKNGDVKTFICRWWLEGDETTHRYPRQLLVEYWTDEGRRDSKVFGLREINKALKYYHSLKPLKEAL